MQALTANPVAKWIIILILLLGIVFFHEFLVPALGAMIITFVTWRLYTDLVRFCRGNTLVAASIATTIIVLVIVLPFLLLLHYLYGEIMLFRAWLIEANTYGVDMPSWLLNLPYGEELGKYWMEYLGTPNGVNLFFTEIGLANLSYVAAVTKSVTKSFSALGFTLLFMMIILFFCYKDGRRVSRQLDKVGERVFPGRWKRISRIVPTLVSSTVSGMVIIAIGEGIVFGIVYYFVGAPVPITLGIITGIFALIPGGAPMSMTLVSLYLVGNNQLTQGIILFCWGTMQLFIVDKTIRPRLVGGAVKLPFLPTILGLVGGVKTMGIIGLFIGPVIMALLVAIWREWVHEDNPRQLDEALKAEMSKNT